MARLREKTDFHHAKDLPELARFSSQFATGVEAILNGRIEFGENIRSQTVSVTFPQANVDVAVRHKLNKIPVNFLVVNKSQALDVYHGAGADTLGMIFLRSTVAGATVTLILF